MELYILRHGEAEGLAVSDSARALTERGKLETAAIAKQQLVETQFDAVYASPYVRAQQTARLVKKAIGFEGEITATELLTPDADYREVTTFLSECVGNRVLIVSHQPLVSTLVSWLVEGHIHSPPPMGTSNLAVLSADVVAPGLATLKAIYP